jgi:2-polyprenyl-3-methyl-5-hydroxy-6-metoxy-1,4-benzoquinol methylase
MKSPVVPNANAKLLKRISVDEITKSYKEKLNIDVKRFFENFDYIELYECESTGYKFYYPFNLIMGDSEFYQLLEENDWYYMPWKWEHQEFLAFAKKEDKILEIGSGGLGFIKKMSRLGYNITGLELNSRSISKANKLNLNVKQAFIEDFAKDNVRCYDVVCSFQVLEHVCDITSFLNASLEVLKKGGKLVVCVPNNDSFIKLDIDSILNMPPHHAGKWDTDSLVKLQNHYPINLKNILYEPLQEYHVNWYVYLMLNNMFLYKHIPFGKGIIYWMYKKIVNFWKNKIKGHSIFVVYEKL